MNSMNNSTPRSTQSATMEHRNQAGAGNSRISKMMRATEYSSEGTFGQRKTSSSSSIAPYQRFNKMAE
eukprot:UN16713